MSQYEQIGQYCIYFDETYYLTYTGGHRELSIKQQQDYCSLLKLPLGLRLKEQVRLGFENNPNIIPIKGRNLLLFIKELKFTPFFDYFFNATHLIQLNDLIVYESIKQRNYNI